MANSIVTVNVTQVSAALPLTLQNFGALVSQGNTTNSTGTLTALRQLSDIVPYLSTGAAISSLAWASGVVTVMCAGPHSIPVGATVGVAIQGATPTGYNGFYQATATDSVTLIYPLAFNPGAESVPGTISTPANNQVFNMATTFFAQGVQTSVYVLELGTGSAAAGITALNSYITNNPGQIYSWLVPTSWDADATFVPMLNNYNTATSKTYFHVTTTTGTYSQYGTLKCVLTTVPAPTSTTIQFTAAAQFWVTLTYKPSTSNKLTPLSFAYVYGVTPWPASGNGAQLAAFKAANVGYIGVGAEGGISNTIIFWGHTMDGNPFGYWYAVDWVQIHTDQDLAAAVINGSNNPQAPLYYNQAGINVLQDTATNTISSSVAYGIGNGSVTQTSLSNAAFYANFRAGVYAGKLVINAEPFAVYASENPQDYSTGRYAGLSLVFTPQRGFEQIIVALNVVNFV